MARQDIDSLKNPILLLGGLACLALSLVSISKGDYLINTHAEQRSKSVFILLFMGIIFIAGAVRNIYLKRVKTKR